MTSVDRHTELESEAQSERPQSDGVTNLWMKLYTIQSEFVVGDGGCQVAGASDHLEVVGDADHRVAVREEHLLRLLQVSGGG